jgi:hypothetical protein
VVWRNMALIAITSVFALGAFYGDGAAPVNWPVSLIIVPVVGCLAAAVAAVRFVWPHLLSRKQVTRRILGVGV